MFISRLSLVIAILGALGLAGLVFWGYWDYHHRQPAIVTFEGVMEESSSVTWSVANAVVWGEPLSSSVKVMGKRVICEAGEGGKLHLDIVASSHNLLQWLQEQGIQVPSNLDEFFQWAIEQGVDISSPLIRAPSVTLITEEVARVQIGMSMFDSIKLVYHIDTDSRGTILQFSDINQPTFGDWVGLVTNAEALVTGETESGFHLEFNDGYDALRYSAEGHQDGPSGELVATPPPHGPAVLLTPTLSVAVCPGECEVGIDDRWGFTVRIPDGQATLHTKVRWVMSHLNSGSLAIGGQAPVPIPRERLTIVIFGGTDGGELEVDTSTRNLRFFGNATTVQVDWEEQLSRRLDYWPWYRQWGLTSIFTVLMLQGVLFRLFRRYRKDVTKVSDKKKSS